MKHSVGSGGAFDRIRLKAAEKLPGLFGLPGAVVPDSDIVEEASGAEPAAYAASLVPEGSVVADLTAGLGGNTVAFAQKASEVWAIERDAARAASLEHNLRLAGVENVRVVRADCLDWLEGSGRLPDVCYVDPERRNVAGRQPALADWSPALPELCEVLGRKYNESGRFPRMLAKVSPMLDLKQAMRELPAISAFHIVEFGREVKELLLDISPHVVDGHADPLVRCVRISRSGNVDFSDFHISDFAKNAAVPLLGGKDRLKTGGFLYEPSPALMKAGIFGALAERFPDLKKLAPDTHLFFSEAFFPSFPGRIFRIDGLVGSAALKAMKGERVNVLSRNHPAKASDIERKFRLVPAGDTYIIACTVGRDRLIVLSERITIPSF